VDDIDRIDAAKEAAAGIGIGGANRGLHQRQRLQGQHRIGGSINDFADTDDDRGAVGGQGHAETPPNFAAGLASAFMCATPAKTGSGENCLVGCAIPPHPGIFAKTLRQIKSATLICCHVSPSSNKKD
jgi:hypothetical protein